jgi:hypothetical protein
LNLRERKYQEAGEDCMMRSFIICFSPNFITVIKSRRKRWVEHVAQMGEVRNVYKIIVTEYEGNGPF